jgi:hypothetical protein
LPIDWLFWRFSPHYDPLARRRATEKAVDESPAWQLVLIAGPLMLGRALLRWNWRVSILLAAILILLIFWAEISRAFA